jgi:hypothetical protein
MIELELFEASMNGMVLKTIEDIDKLMYNDQIDQITKRDVICLMYKGYSEVMTIIEAAMDNLNDQEDEYHG